MKRIQFASLALFLVLIACGQQPPPANEDDLISPIPGNIPPTPIPNGILIREIPTNMDIIFDSIRYVLNDVACLDENYEVDRNFINLPGCNALIYDSQDNGLASPRQLFAMDLETGEVLQITNTNCLFILGQAVDTTTLMTLANCSDTDNNGKVNEKDKPELYLLDLVTGDMDCLTCEHDLTSINNADYELTIIDVDTRKIEILDSHYANMVPQWKSGGILINRQVGGASASEMMPMELKQSLYLYRGGRFEEIENYPYNVFPLGAYGGYWIELE